MACHHSAERLVRGCPACHDESEGVGAALPAAPASSREVRAPGTGDASLPFGHDDHRAVPCASCHEAGPGLAVTRTCDSCHERHHRADAYCPTCHVSVPPVHEADAHLGCGGAECHTSPAVLTLPETRPFCLTCHADRVDHEPGGECATCHPTGRSPGMTGPDAGARP